MSYSDFHNIDKMKSYATEDNLKAGLTKLGFDEWHYLVVCNRKGRFTALFPKSFNDKPGRMFNAPAFHGFMVIG